MSDKPSRMVKGRGDSSSQRKPKLTSKNPDQVKKIELMREIDQLEKRISAIEREKNTQLYGRKNDFRKDFCQLKEQEAKLENERRSEKNKLQQNLAKLRHQVDKFQHELRNVKPTPEFVQKLKELMEVIEAALNEFKDQQRKLYEQLMRDEHLFFQEVSELDKHFDMWSQLPPVTIPDTKPKKSGNIMGKQSSLTDVPPEVADFERFLQQTGGHRGGWDEYDHGTFIRIRNKHKSGETFLDEATNSLPGRSITDVKNHEAWYLEYTTLMDKKKEAIQKWRLVKDAKKSELLNQADLHEQDQAAVNEIKVATRAKKLEDDRRTNFARLNAWKVQKELEKMQAEEKRLLEERRTTKKYELERKRQLEIRVRVEEFREQQKEDEAESMSLEDLARMEAEKEEKRRMAQEEISRFRERDRRKREEHKARERQREAAERTRMEKLKKLKGQVEIKVTRDPTRLYKLTKGLEERQKCERIPSNGPVLSIPHRAIPSWRAGIS